jgi:SAM-dependent methyltransferase
MIIDNSNSADLVCLLCGSSRISIRYSLSAEEILKCWAQAGQHFSLSAVQSLLDERMIHLYDCRECGFQFFNPKLAGGGEFYEQLHAQGPGYYAPDRAENKRNVRFAIQHGYHNILDVGCGSGFALDEARRAGLETYGIELSRSAAAVAAERGHTVFPVLLENLDSVWEGKFALISLNQVLEHVPNPAELVRQCIRFLSPRGAIAIAVPSAPGVLRFAPWLPANWPPHHVSRWRIKDFDTLARKSNLRVVETGGNQLLGGEIQMYLLEHRQHCLTLKKPYHGFPPFLIKSLCFIYRKTGLKYIFRSQGHGIYCYLEKTRP